MRKPWQEKRKRKEEENLKYIKDYEESLELHYDSKRKELDLLIGSSMPHQINNIKMVLWLNFLFLGGSASLFKQLSFHGLYLISYLFSFFAIAMMIFALTRRGTKLYGSIDEEDYVKNKMMDAVYPRAKMLAGLMKSTYDAVEHNRSVLQDLSKYLRSSMYATFMAITTFFIFLLTFNVFLENNINNAYPQKMLMLNKDKEAKIN